jgi:hypothetical protein
VTMYPELAARLRTAADAEANALFAPVRGRSPETSKGVDPEPHDGNIHIWPVRDNLYMLIGDGGNIVVQTGDQGAFVVDSGEGKLSEKVLAAIRTLTNNPIQFIANTNFRREHTGGNAVLGAAGQDLSLPGSFFLVQSPRSVTGFFDDPLARATMMAHANVQVRMQAAGALAGAVPADTYLEDRRRKFHNGSLASGAIEGDHLLRMPGVEAICCRTSLDSVTKSSFASRCSRHQRSSAMNRSWPHRAGRSSRRARYRSKNSHASIPRPASESAKGWTARSRPVRDCPVGA